MTARLIEPSARRSEPYTERGILRVRCSRPDCQNRAFFQWMARACASGEVEFYKPLCVLCDIELNRQTLAFFQHPDVDAAIAAYREHALAEWRANGFDEADLR